MTDFRILRAHLGYIQPHWFVEFYLRDNGYQIEDFQNHHIQILTALKPDQRGQKINIQAPRGSAKTTCIAVWYPLWRICYRDFDQAMDTQTEDFILITRRNETMAIESMRDIARIIETNPLIKADFGDLQGPVWRAKELETKNGAHIKPNGRGQSPRGALIRDMRPTLLIADDLEDPELCLNPDNRNKDETWFFTDWMACGDIGERITNYVVIDTNKHPESLSEKLRKQPGWRNLRYQAIPFPEDLYHPTAEHLWKQWETSYSDMTLDDDEREAQAFDFYQANQTEMTAGVQELWPRVLSYLSIRKRIVSRGYHYVMREYQNIADDPSMNLFDMDNAVTFSVADEGLLRSDNRLVPWSEIGGFTTYLDTAGSRDTVDGSFACAVVVAWQPLPGHFNEHNIKSMAGVNGYVLSAWLGRAAITEQMEQAILLAQRAESILAPAFPESNFVCEQRPDIDGAIRMSTDHAFRAAKQKYEYNKSIIYHPQHQNKELRIETLEPYITNGWLAFNEKGLPAEFWIQFRQFPSADHNDAPDATQGACRARITSTHTDREAERYDQEHQSDISKVSIY